MGDHTDGSGMGTGSSRHPDPHSPAPSTHPYCLTSQKFTRSSADDLALDDVAEDVLLDVVVAEVGRLDRGREPVVPAIAEAAVDQRVGLGRAVIGIVSTSCQNALSL